jgi:tetratricopeptide (TPR) repeat protein
VSLFLRAALFSSFAATLSAQGVVSVEELRHPLTGNSLRAINTAHEHLKSGQRERGLEELRQAMNDPMAMPYAISILGAEHLKSGQTDTALRELEQAVRLLPRPENHSNLALAFYRARQTERGLEEVRKALRLDPAKPKTRLVLGLLLLQQGSHDAQAIRNLEAAAEEVPRAHLVLAQHYDQAGRAPEAERERRAYEVTSMGLLAGK